MSSDHSVTQWIAQLEFGRQDRAQEELWRRYFGRLVALARLKLGDTPRGVADEEDVAIAALNSFFDAAGRGRFPHLHDRHDLWPLLAKITARKALDQRRHLMADKRGGGLVRGDSAIVAPDSSGQWPAGALEDELRPDYLVDVNEQCQRLMNLLPDEQMREIARRRLEGYTNAEIAEALGVVERTVERRLGLIRNYWAAEVAG
jgi:DNA-directed RNA polymerase specialized sigma24 family protein